MTGILSVKDVMTKDVKVVRPDTTMQEVIATMLKFDISSVIVVQNDKPVGIITHKDIIQKVLKPTLLPDVLTAKNVMSTPVITIKEEVSVTEAAQLMTAKGLKKLPIIRREKLVGILTSTDIIREQPRLIGLLEELVRPSAKEK